LIAKAGSPLVKGEDCVVPIGGAALLCPEHAP
jgi:hypothetical protein